MAARAAAAEEAERREAERARVVVDVGREVVVVEEGAMAVASVRGMAARAAEAVEVEARAADEEEEGRAVRAAAKARVVAVMARVVAAVAAKVAVALRAGPSRKGVGGGRGVCVSSGTELVSIFHLKAT